MSFFNFFDALTFVASFFSSYKVVRFPLFPNVVITAVYKQLLLIVELECNGFRGSNRALEQQTLTIEHLDATLAWGSFPSNAMFNSKHGLLECDIGPTKPSVVD
jgi:hypothetical protein